MSTEPTFPPDAAVGDPAAGAAAPFPASGGETLGVAVSAKENSNSSDGQRGGRTTRNFVAGAAVGVGSAALVAALLYANRSRRTDGVAEKDPGVARVLDESD